MLLHLPGILVGEELANLQRSLTSAAWTDGRATAGHDASLVKRNQQLAEDAPETKNLARLVHQALVRHHPFTSAVLPVRISPPMFNRYSDGMGYGDHIDGAVRGGGAVVRGDVSATLFLSDPASYEGGELVIEDAFGPRTVKLPAGDLVVYPASSIHRVTPVTRGVRLASFLWIQSMVRHDHRRSLLHDLDRTLGGLRERGMAGTPELVMLAGIYHNLLREWAET